MNDLVLTALINLFALFCTSSSLKRERAKSVIYNYLVRFFGIRNYQEYIDLYDTLCDVYELSAPDQQRIVSQVCERLKNEIPEETQALMVLRLMEFSSLNISAYHAQQALFWLVAQKFGVDDGLYADFERFVIGQAEGNVCIRHIATESITLKALLLPRYNKTVVSYEGDTQLFMNDLPMQPGIFMPWEKNGVIKSRRGTPIYYSYIERELRGVANVAADIHFVGQHVDFRFPGSNNGLHDFSFSLHSGTLVAIMGGSGAGKSTMMNILNGNMRPDSGHVLINGEDLYENVERLKPLIGFVPQDDLLIAELTVYQNLYYTARFCFGDLTEDEMERRITKTLADLDLLPIKDMKVGSPLNKTISGGQRKRLNIALELIREPQILFLDEPTSGLSSADSEMVVHLLKNQTYQGRLVLTCIHQPSSDIYKLFDCLWLLDRGGYPIYDGNPIQAVVYFKQAANYADAETAICDTCGNINPEIILNIVEAKALDSNGQTTDKRKIQPEEWVAMRTADADDTQTDTHDDVSAAEEHIGVKSVASKHATKRGILNQGFIYLRRNLHTKMQDKQFLIIALLEAPVLALIVAMLTRYSGDDGYSLYENKNLLSYIFMAVIVATFMGMSGSAEEIFRDRALLRRENFLQLSYGGYIFSKVVTAALISAVQTLLFIAVGNWMLGIRCLFAEWWAVMFASEMLASLIGLILSQRMKSLVAIYITIPLLLIPQILLCGVVVSFDDLNQHSTTRNVPFIGEVIPSRWAFEAIAVTMFAQNDYSRPYFSDEACQYELQMARLGIIHKLNELNEAEHMALSRNSDEQGRNLTVIEKEVAKLAERWHLELPSVDWSHGYDETVYKALNQWLKDADRRLYMRSHVFTQAIDKAKQAFINENGGRALVDLKYANANKNLEQTLVGTNAERMVCVESDVIVPQIGTVYLDPPSHNGRAPFYSSIKILGSLRIPTLPFNLSVLAVMGLLSVVILLSKRD